MLLIIIADTLITIDPELAFLSQVWYDAESFVLYTSSAIDFLVANIPIEIAPSETYTISVPSSFAEENNSMSTDCGVLNSVDSTNFEIVVPALYTFQDYVHCYVTINETIFDVDMLTLSFWSNPIYYGPVTEHAPISVIVDNPIAPIKLPFAQDVVNGAFAGADIVFIAIPDFPAGIYVDHHNFITGTPTIAGTTHLTVYAMDVFNKLQNAIGNYTFDVVQPIDNSISAAILSLEIVLPILTLAFILIIVFIIRQRRIARQPFDFTMLVAENAVDIRPDAPRLNPRELTRSSVKTLGLIGKGSFAEVYKGLLSEKGMPGYLVAVKLLHNSMDKASDRLQLLAEASLMVQFDHENVVRLIGVVTSGDPLLVVLEYCEGGSLERFLNECIITPDRQLKFSIDCAKGMTYLTSLNFVHRDLAARNVLVSSDLTAKIGDFGLSRQNIDDKNYYISRHVTVSIRWASPEALEERRFSEQSDVWSYGVLLWEIWSMGELPYNGIPSKKVWANVIKGVRLKRPAESPEDIYLLMAACWDEYGQRPKFSEILDTLVRYDELKKTQVPDSSSSAGSPPAAAAATPIVPQQRNTIREEQSFTKSPLSTSQRKQFKRVLAGPEFGTVV